MEAAGLVLAAGLSKRMGRPKLTLPWGETTVIGQVVATLADAGVSQVVVVTGREPESIAAALAGAPARCVFNPDYANGEMLSSLRVGLAAMPAARAALVCLGDQPQMLPATVAAVLAEGARLEWRQTIIPSYHMRAGHPILLPNEMWAAVQATTGTLRDVLRAHADQVHYLVVDTPTILADLDTPEDYERERRQAGE